MALLVISTLTPMITETSAADGIGVTVKLTDDRGTPITGYNSNGDMLVTADLTVTIGGGVSVIELIPNAELVPANTYYTVTVGSRSFLISKGADTETLFDCLV